MDLGSFYIGQLEIFTGDFLIGMVLFAISIGILIGMKIQENDILTKPENYGLVKEEDLF